MNKPIRMAAQASLPAEQTCRAAVRSALAMPAERLPLHRPLRQRLLRQLLGILPQPAALGAVGLLLEGCLQQHSPL